MYDLFSDLFDGFDWFMQPTTYKEEKKCPVCGRTETLRQIHPSTVHVGKIPSKSGEELKLKRKYETLKQELSAAVKNEDYETAAKLHKQIREIENEVKKS